ncbi:MAG: DotU family type IV/VI secretion system protein [Desulfarculus sp.]|nr:DotU family type IV/VI secretion system protein [Desulfarculus sp.]
MTLLDLTKELFTYLVRFREQAAGEHPPTLEKVEADLEAIFARMRDGAEANPLLSKGLEEVRYSLAALVDEVVLTSVWPHQSQWGQRGWERRLFGSQDGPRRFFAFLDRLDSLPKDVLAVHYLCLALGFCGCYQPDDPELQRVKARVLTRLPGLDNGGGPLPPPAISLTPLPTKPGPPASPNPSKAAMKVRPMAGGHRTWGLRYLLIGGLAVLAFVFTLGLGVMIFYDGGSDQAEETTLEDLLKPLLPSRPAEVAPAPTASGPTSAQTIAQNTAPATSPSAPTASTTTLGTATSTTATSTTATRHAPSPDLASAAAAGSSPANAPGADAPGRTPTQPHTSTPTADPEPPAPPAEKDASPAAPTTYLLHAGLFVGPIQSGRLAEQLSQAGFAAWVREEPRQDGSVRYRVYVGPFADPQLAEAARQAIAAQFKFSPFLVENTTP